MSYTNFTYSCLSFESKTHIQVRLLGGKKEIKSRLEENPLECRGLNLFLLKMISILFLQTAPTNDSGIELLQLVG